MTSKCIKFTKIISVDEWLTELVNTLNKYCNDIEVEYLVNKINNYYSLNVVDDLYIEEQFRQSRFFNYLNSRDEIFNSKYFIKAINYSLESRDFINSFIYYIVSTNIDDIKVSTNILEKREANFFSHVLCTLGDYPLASVDLLFLGNSINFDNLKVNFNIRRLGIGSLMLKEIMKDIIKFYPNYNLYANNVLKENKIAIEFYKTLGGEITDSECEDFYSVTFKNEKMKLLCF